MKTSPNLPPNFAAIQAVLPVTKASPMVYTYGDTIYNVVKDLPHHLTAHEEVHMHQQQSMDMGPEGWWAHYLHDPEFRTQQEIEAYARQYVVARNITGVGHIRGASWALEDFMDQLASALSAPEYNSGLTFAQARSKIRNKVKELQ